MSLECVSPEGDVLNLHLDDDFAGLLEEVGNGDDAVHFSASVQYFTDNHTQLHRAALALTDQGLYFMDESYSTVLHHVGVDCILDLATHESHSLMHIETDDVNVFFKGESFEEVERFVLSFTDGVLPLPVDARDAEALPQYAAEKEFGEKLCSELGLAKGDVEGFAVVDAVDALEEKRQMRMAAEKEAAEAAEEEALQKKEALRQQVAEDRLATQAAHEKGMRRLSIRRKNCEHVGRELKRWRLGNADDVAPPWWEGEWDAGDADDFDPFVIDEGRVNAIVSVLQAEAEKVKAEKMKRIMAVLDQVAREETNLRHVIEGEYRLVLSDVRDLYERDRSLLRKSEQEWRAMSATLIARLEREETPVRMKHEMDEEHDRRRVVRSQALNLSRLEDVVKLLRSTAADEQRIREEVGKLETRQWDDTMLRWAAGTRKARRKANDVVPPTITTTTVQPPSPTDADFTPQHVDFKKVLMERTKSVRRRHLAVSRGTTPGPRTLSPTTLGHQFPTSPVSERSFSASELDVESQGTTTPLESPRHTRQLRGFSGALLSLPGSVPTSPIRASALASANVTPRRGSSPRVASGGMSGMFPGGFEVGGGGGAVHGDFASRHRAAMEGMQTQLRLSLGLAADRITPAKYAAISASLAVTAVISEHLYHVNRLLAVHAQIGGTVVGPIDNPIGGTPDNTATVVNEDSNGGVVVEWGSGVVTVKPRWSEAVVYTYKPVAQVVHKTFSARSTARSRRGSSVRGSVSPARSVSGGGGGVTSPPPAYTSRRSVSPGLYARSHR